MDDQFTDDLDNVQFLNPEEDVDFVKNLIENGEWPKPLKRFRIVHLSNAKFTFKDFARMSYLDVEIETSRCPGDVQTRIVNAWRHVQRTQQRGDNNTLVTEDYLDQLRDYYGEDVEGYNKAVADFKNGSIVLKHPFLK